ncbi:zinc-dependent metalloprotease [Mumia sp.]|uniref:zinc-dependent metalloprotease n=1 Tax=Mumia sp. TaxID=1965300 RepID=UPI002613B9AD|nr:zinc-dependent metalloprotease [Mumia sp.]MDD9348809.1 zinc-dependent metalloprotease [Mumia sp.]
MTQSMIDWDFALATAVRMTRTGPEVAGAEAADAVAELREGAARSEGSVREFTGLSATAASAPILVVDRPGWIAANVASFEVVLAPMLTKASRAAADRGQTPGRIGRSVGSRITGAELGAALAFLSTKVLGQFDPFFTAPAGADGVPVGGRLLLVAPNVVHVERELDVDPHDFRLWVCLHEETHRVQFTAVPWMRAHVQGLIDQLVDATDMDPEGVSRSLGELGKAAGRMVKGERVSLIEVLQNDQQREVVDKVTGVMSLLEGHADVVMDGVGPSVIPSVAQIRKRFEKRRGSGGPLDRIVRQVLGLDAKMRQYRDGAAFVRTVEKQVGRDGFDAVWAAPETLPSAAEIEKPDLWVARVHG